MFIFSLASPGAESPAWPNQKKPTLKPTTISLSIIIPDFPNSCPKCCRGKTCLHKVPTTLHVKPVLAHTGSRDQTRWSNGTWGCRRKTRYAASTSHKQCFALDRHARVTAAQHGAPAGSKVGKQGLAGNNQQLLK